MSRRKKRPLLTNIEITDISSEGKSVGRSEDLVVFVSGCIPGDIADVQVTRKKKNYAEGYPVAFHKYSPDRKEALCKHFGVCGGCKWQHLDYKKQLYYKQRLVVENLKKISGLNLPPENPILPSEKQEFYRNKLEFTFTPTRWLTKAQIDSGETLERRGIGLHLPGRFDKVLDLERCYLQADPSNEIRLAVRNFVHENDLSCYNVRDKKGLLRNLIIRNTSQGEWMVIVQFFEDKSAAIEKVMAFLHAKFPQITALMYVINPKGNDTFYDLELVCYAGKPYITEQMEGLQFRISPKSFYQTNSAQALRLYQTVRQMAQLSGTQTVYDLYTGTGTIANFVAGGAKKVIGLESVPQAVEDARINAQINQITNTQFLVGDMKTLFTPTLTNTYGTPEVVITDPPRAGMHEKVVQSLLDVTPEKIVYVSCNPATQARDLALLKAKYKVEAIQAVDMFPHTYHVENVLLLQKNTA